MRRSLIVLTFALAAMVPGGAALGANVSSFSGLILYAGDLGEANNILLVRSGADYLITDSVPITINMGTPCLAAGVNTVRCPAAGIGSLRVSSSDGNDTVVIDDSISGVETELRGGPGADQITGGNNTDDLIADFFPAAEGDVLLGRGGDDRIGGGDGADTIDGGAGRDQLSGALGNDTITGGADSDRIDAGAAADGADVMSGGPGSDAVLYFNRTQGVTITANGVADDGEPGEGDNVAADIEEIDGGAGNDTIALANIDGAATVGGAGNDTITGGSAGDLIIGSDGNDTLLGGAGGDLMVGGIGIDTVDGGAGDDTFESGFIDDEPDIYRGGSGTDRMGYEAANAAVNVTLDGVANDGVAGESDNVATDVEDVVGSAFGDTLTGNGSANQLDGGPGNDTLTGGGGSDGLDGGRGDDTLDGGTGIDALEGADGADRIRARDTSADDVSCGAGVDIAFVNRSDQRAACETSTLGVAFATRAARAQSGRVTLSLACPAAEARTCRGSLRLLRGATIFGARTFAIPAGATRRVTVTLTPTARAALRRAASLTASARFTDAAGSGRAVTIRR